MGLAGRSPGETKHRGLDFPHHLTPQKDSTKDPDLSAEALKPGVEPELRPEGRRSLRLGVRTGGSPAFGGLGPTGCLHPPHLLACLPCRLCSPKRLLPPPPLQKVLLQRSAPRGVERGGGTKPFCQVSKDLLGSLHGRT